MQRSSLVAIRPWLIQWNSWQIGLLTACAILASIIGFNQLSTHRSAPAPASAEKAVASFHDANPSMPNASPQAGIAGGVAGGIMGGVLGGITTYSEQKAEDSSYMSTASKEQVAAQQSETVAADRQLIQTATLDLVVGDVAKVANDCSAIAVKFGGYVENQTISGSEAQERQATISLRVPADRLQEVLGILMNSATKIRNEQIKSEDITLHYVDLQARLRNKRAEEQQYLELMKRAGSIKELLGVTGQLSSTREEIETGQAEMNYLSHRIAMASITISLVTPARDVRFSWTPLQNAARAWQASKESLADWFDWIVSIVISLPVILAWFLSILVAGILGWRILRFAWKRLGLPSISAWRTKEPAPRNQAV